MNRKWAIGCAAAVVATAIAASASGMQDDGAMHSRASGFVLRRMEHRLGITDAQRASLRSILKAEQPTIQGLAERVRQQNVELTSQSSFNEAQVRTFAKQHEATMEDVLVEREKVRFEVLQVLTPAQRDKLAHLRAEHSGALVDRLSGLADQI